MDVINRYPGSSMTKMDGPKGQSPKGTVNDSTYAESSLVDPHHVHVSLAVYILSTHSVCMSRRLNDALPLLVCHS